MIEVIISLIWSKIFECGFRRRKDVEFVFQTLLELSYIKTFDAAGYFVLYTYLLRSFRNHSKMGLEGNTRTIESATPLLRFPQPLVKLGEGSFGVCVRAKLRVRSEIRTVAVKISKDQICTDNKAIKMIQTEVNTLKDLSHKNVVEYLGKGGGHDSRGQPFAYMILALATHGSLGDWLRRKEKPFSRIKIIYQILTGLNYLHVSEVYHRDLKPDNILVHRGSGGDYILKITDFGLATKALYSQSRRGTILYLAPEVYNMARPYLVPAIDIFAVGVIMIKLLDPDHELPWSDEITLMNWVSVGGWSVYAGKQIDFHDFFVGTFTTPEYRKTARELGAMARKMMEKFGI